MYKKGDKTDCSTYRGVSLLSTMYKILSFILLSRSTPYTEEIIGEYHCGLRYNRPVTDHVFCILETKWKSSASTVHRLQEAYDAITRELLHNIAIEFGIHVRLVRLIKVCLNETYS